ncbi:unnamed protein product [Phaedon cochleariae]|uniref:PHD-type domain-containing protein n=1 Tax=Phaedon cochleariae TaxID=80249 RepID=A0A9N9S7Q4_PHACE|nr:unnamed protein product [Phaedon cochleariae]
MSEYCSVCVDLGGRPQRGPKFICMVCKKSLHAKCSNLSADAEKILSIPGIPWRCPSCSNSEVASNGNTDGSSNESFNMILKKLDKLDKIEQNITDLKTSHDDVLKFVNFCSDKIDEFTVKMKDFENDFKDIKGAKSQIKNLQDDNNKLMREIGNLQQYSRINNVEISGLPEIKDENLIEIIEKLMQVLGCNINRDSIDGCHRIAHFNLANKKPRNVIVKFSRHQYKDEVLAAIRKRKLIESTDLDPRYIPSSKIYLNEHLTKMNKDLFKNVREYCRGKHFLYYWTRDCKIYVRNTTTSKTTLIQEENDLNKIQT